MSELIPFASRRDLLKSGALLAAAPVLLKGAPLTKAIKGRPGRMRRTRHRRGSQALEGRRLLRN